MTTQNVGGPRHFASTVFATTAIVCFSYSVFALLLLHLLRRDYSARSHMISDYGVGPYGWVMSTCFIAMGCGLLMLVLGLLRSGPSSGVARIGTLLLGVAATGLVVSAMFPTDLPGGPSTRSGEIHSISFLVNVGSIILGTALLSLSFGSDSRWRSYRRTARNRKGDVRHLIGTRRHRHVDVVHGRAQIIMRGKIAGVHTVSHHEIEVIWPARHRGRSQLGFAGQTLDTPAA